MTAKEWTNKLTPHLVRYQHTLTKVTEERFALKEEKRRAHAAEEACSVAQQVAQSVQNTAVQRLAAIVSRCLRAVFGPQSYELSVRFRAARGKTEAELFLVKDQLELNPADAAGGGVVDVAAFGLRLACLLLATPPRRKLLVMDEPFKHLSKDYRPAVRELLERLCEELGVQILMVTHDAELATGKVIHVGA